MDRTSIDLAREESRGIDALQGTGVPAVYADAVRVDFPDYALLYISGMIAIDADPLLRLAALLPARWRGRATLCPRPHWYMGSVHSISFGDVRGTRHR